MTHKIAPAPLTAEAFKVFGDVIETSEATEKQEINEGNTTRYHDLATLDLIAEDGRPGVNIFRSQPRPLPLVLNLMERHPKSSQAFFPLGDTPYLVVVAPPGELEPSSICAFIARPDQGVNYHAGTWHHYSLALDKTSDFLVIDRIGDDENCDEVTLADSDFIEIDMSGLE